MTKMQSFNGTSTSTGSLRLLVLLLTASLSTLLTEAFVSSQMRTYDTRLQQSSFSKEPPTSSNGNTDAMRHEIEAMKQEATRRLENLAMDLEEFKFNKAASTYIGNEGSSVSLRSMEGGETNTLAATSITADSTTTTTSSSSSSPDTDKAFQTSSSSSSSKAESQILLDVKEIPESMILHQPVNVHLLENTRWKVVFNLGREPGTWMPPSWGASGERLRFTAVIDLLDTSLQDRDDFFEGHDGAKKLRVLEAWIGPTFDDSYHGRRNLRVNPVGGYKVVRGAGPSGTDVFRFFIECEEAFRVTSDSDVHCPSGRIYGNCGYFPRLDTDVRDKYHRYKDNLQTQFRQLSNTYQRLKTDDDKDENLISWGKVKRMKEEIRIRGQLKELQHKIDEARQRDPDLDHLRMSRKGDVGLTRDGGVCCKVRKGLALEYHILGRMEIAAEETDHGNIHEDYEDLVHKLHP